MADESGATVTPSRGGFLRLVTALPPHNDGRGGRMVTWSEAHSVANMAAAQAHVDLDVDLNVPRIDVLKAIRAADVQLMWQPMPTVFGAYVNEPGSEPGILVNSGLPAAARRYTASHDSVTIGCNTPRMSTTEALSSPRRFRSQITSRRRVCGGAGPIRRSTQKPLRPGFLCRGRLRPRRWATSDFDARERHWTCTGSRCSSALPTARRSVTFPTSALRIGKTLRSGNGSAQAG